MALSGRVALVTNATTSLGYSIARQLGLAGAKIFLNDTDKARLQHALDGMKGVNIVSAGTAFDLAKEDERNKMFSSIREEMGQLDIAVLGNKPNQIKGNIMDNSAQEFEKMFADYLTLPVLLSHGALPLMEKSNNGNIILLSHVSGYTPFLDLGLYSATQTGVLGLCKVLAQSLASKKIRVNSVCLGMCDDDNSGASWSTTCGYSSEEDVKKAQMTRQQLRDFIPLGRTGRAGDCTGLIEFLASDQASWVNIVLLDVVYKLVFCNKVLKYCVYMFMIPVSNVPQSSNRRVRLLELVAKTARENRTKSSTPLVPHKYSPTVVLFSKRKTFSAPDVPHNFRQCSHFRYLSGFDLPETARLVINPTETIIFREERDANQILWEGAMVGEEEIKQLCAVDRVMPLSEFEAYMASCLKSDTLLSLDYDSLEHEAKFDSDLRKCLQYFQGVSLKVPLITEVNKLRWIKSAAEIDMMRQTCKIGSESLNAIMSQAGTATNESHIVGMLEYQVRRRGAQFLAYPPVVAAGSSANTIHYISSNKDMRKSDCVLVDAGSDFHGYVSDITRSFPISGQFSTTNKMLYDALNFVQTNLLKYVNENLSMEEMIAECDKLCLDVHDTPTIPRNIDLPPGVIITVEPGIYVPPGNTSVRDEFKNIGFRIEDDILITESGSEVLTDSCVRYSEEIEFLMKSQ
uniref:Aminopeptidase P N-terminal domain-containing protein n=1 Tax=Ditylenchus dipsaci TaxID=166011 RepID=A0A915DV48_9BILA